MFTIYGTLQFLIWSWILFHFVYIRAVNTLKIIFIFFSQFCNCILKMPDKLNTNLILDILNANILVHNDGAKVNSPIVISS